MANTSFIEVGGRRLECEDIAGDTSRRALVFLHEGLGSVGLWRGFPAAVAAATGRRAVAFSRFGHGRSDPPPGPRTPSFMDEEALEVLPAVLEALDVSAPVLVGHSDGATIALIHAAARPTSALALLAPHVFAEEVTVEGIRETRSAYVDGDLRERLARHHDDPDATFGGWCDVWLDPAFRSWSIEGALGSIACPVLLLQGVDDGYASLGHIEAIERGVRGPTERLLSRGGHSPHLEHPDEVVAAVSGFVERYSR